jgi:hypothetical protein
MEFSGQYLTYEEYKVLGGTLDLMPFNVSEYEIRRMIDIRTQNRLKNVTIPEEVKMCENRMINSIEPYINSIKSISENGNVASVGTDGYSESYITPTQIKDIILSKKTEMEDIMRNYLVGVIVNDEHIMYLGV